MFAAATTLAREPYQACDGVGVDTDVDPGDHTEEDLPPLGACIDPDTPVHHTCDGATSPVHASGSSDHFATFRTATCVDTSTYSAGDAEAACDPELHGAAYGYRFDTFGVTIDSVGLGPTRFCDCSGGGTTPAARSTTTTSSRASASTPSS